MFYRIRTRRSKMEQSAEGAQLFMLNVHMWQLGRLHAATGPRTISVQERHANKERAQKAYNNKRKAVSDPPARRVRYRRVLYV